MGIQVPGLVKIVLDSKARLQRVRRAVVGIDDNSMVLGREQAAEWRFDCLECFDPAVLGQVIIVQPYSCLYYSAPGGTRRIGQAEPGSDGFAIVVRDAGRQWDAERVESDNRGILVLIAA